jgi:hypothetical protein
MGEWPIFLEDPKEGTPNPDDIADFDELYRISKVPSLL